VRVNLVGISSEARNSLAVEAQQSGLPPALWEAFVVRAREWSNEPDGQSLVARLDKQVEQFLLRGKP